MKSTRILSATVFLLLAAGLLCPVRAEVKLGVCDTMTILRESEEGKRRLADYQKLGDKKQAELDAITQEVNRLQDQIKQMGPSINADKRTDLERKLEDLVIEGTRKKKDADREMGLMFEDIQEQMGKLVLPIILDVGKEQGYSLILNLQQAGLLYYDEAIDVTPEVIKRFNERSRKAP